MLQGFFISCYYLSAITLFFYTLGHNYLYAAQICRKSNIKNDDDVYLGFSLLKSITNKSNLCDQSLPHQEKIYILLVRV